MTADEIRVALESARMLYVNDYVKDELLFLLAETVGSILERLDRIEQSRGRLIAESEMREEKP